MNKIYIAVVVFVTLASCQKNVNEPSLPNPITALEYTDLGDTKIMINKPSVKIDLNNDGIKDVLFGVLPVGDPVYMQDKYQFFVSTDIETSLPVNTNEEIPVLSSNNSIPLNNFNNYNWYNASSVVLVQKVIGLSNTFWEGHWKNATLKYLPIQIKKNNLRYNGWILLTVDIVSESIVLHKAAVSKQGEKDIVTD